MRSSLRGITLSELLIATLIVSIMVVGIMSTDYAIRRIDRDSSRDTTLSLQTAALAEQYRQAAIKAIGDAQNTGIRISPTQDDETNFICFRHDDEANPTPSNYNDDTWQCFTRLSSDGSSVGVDVFTCTMSAAYGPRECERASTPDLSNVHFVGRLVTDVFIINALKPDVEAPSFDIPPGMFSLQLISRVDPTAGTEPANWPNGTDSNPQVVTKIEISPEAHSF